MTSPIATLYVYKYLYMVVVVVVVVVVVLLVDCFVLFTLHNGFSFVTWETRFLGFDKKEQGDYTTKHVFGHWQTKCDRRRRNKVQQHYTVSDESDCHSICL